jgi:hypothetical protein
VSIGFGTLFVLAASQPLHWTGTITAMVTGHQPGVQHVTRTTIHVTLVEGRADGVTRLRSVGSRYHMDAEISGIGTCHGSADVRLTQPIARSSIDPSGGCHLVLERGFFGWACGRNVGAHGARDVVIGGPPDPAARHLKHDRMAGRYVAHQATNDSSYLFTVEGDLKRF